MRHAWCSSWLTLWVFGAWRGGVDAGRMDKWTTVEDPDWYPVELESGFQFECLKVRCTKEFAACINDPVCTALIIEYNESCYTELMALCTGNECPAEALPLWDCYHSKCLTSWKDDKTHVVRYESVISASERDKIRILARKIDSQTSPSYRIFGGQDREDVRGHNCTYLNSDFVKEMPDVFTRLRSLAEKADKSSGWGLTSRYPFYMRVVEFLDYRIGVKKNETKAQDKIDKMVPVGSIAERRKKRKEMLKRREEDTESYFSNGTLGLGWHLDSYSLVTVVAMLSSPYEYEGGLLQTEKNCNVQSHSMDLGDVHVYRSLQQHRVLPITKGVRQVLVLEFWKYDTREVRGRLSPSEIDTREKARVQDDL